MKLSEHLPNLSDAQISQLERLAEVFLEWNQKLNLSAIRDRDGVLLKHVLDSLLILPFGLIKDGDRVLDMGTGGGFPGLALAIIFPETDFVLVDATTKKVTAVAEMAAELGLSNVSCFAGRAEEMGHDPDFREHFDVVVARALAGFSTLLEYCLPFVRVGGHFVAYQGPELIDTWRGFEGIARKLGGEISEVKTTILPIEEAQRCFVVVKKLSQLSSNYPRAVGLPKKKPLA